LLDLVRQHRTLLHAAMRALDQPRDHAELGRLRGGVALWRASVSRWIFG